MAQTFGPGFVCHMADSVVKRMAKFEQTLPFSSGNDKIYSRWAVLDAGLVSKSLLAIHLEESPTSAIVQLDYKFRYDAGVCFERRESERNIFGGTIILCKNRMEIVEWKAFFENKDVAFLERYDKGPAFQKRIFGKNVWVVSKSVFQKMAVYPARLVCSTFGLTDLYGRFTWVLGFSPMNNICIKYIPDKTAWIRPTIVKHKVHQLFKIADVLFKRFDIPKRQNSLDFMCSVCLEERVTRRLRLECSHRICFDCIFGCVATGHFLCPVCRSPLDKTFVTEDCDDAENERLQNYEMVSTNILKQIGALEKWIVFEQMSRSEISSGLFKFLHQDENVFQACSTATHFPDVNMCLVDGVILSEEHDIAPFLLDSFLNRSLSIYRTKPLFVHCLYYNQDFFEKINTFVELFFK